MSLCLKIGLFIVVWFLVAQKPVYAVSIAEQTQNFGTPFYVWQVVQELGTNLSGTADKFTFRVDTSQSNLTQFDFTALNTRIYDKDNNNSYISGCVPNSSDPLAGLTFQTQGVPSGYQDVTIDFSCHHNFSFTPGHKYLIFITNANIPQFGGLNIRFAAASYLDTTNDYFSDGGLRYANGNIYDYSNNSGSCSPAAYQWNGTNPFKNGCNVWTTTKDDLYFVLSNTSPPPPPPKTPVIFIPGIGGSELKASQDIIWEQPNGHGGIFPFKHAYGANEKIWVNQDEATKLGDDDYFDVLRLKADGVTSEADLSLTGNLTPFGYTDIDSFFTGMGYEKNKNFFVFTYDWRKDVRSNKDSLDALIETAKTASGQTKVNLVVHSMGGLIARYYISDSSKASKVNKLIELGVPHLGATSAMKALVYGEPVGRWYFKIINIGVNGNEVKDVLQNLPSHYSLLPSVKYYDFYNNSIDQPYPFRDDRDIDNNNLTGVLNFDQTKNLLSNLSHNMTVFGISEQFHNSLDSILNQTNGAKIYEIVGTAQPTLGQIHETWWITWPVNLISKTDEIYINGDDTVPLYSASLKNDNLDLSGATRIYYVEQRHSDLVSSSGTAMQTVKSILNDDNALPVEIKDQKITLDGEQLSLDDGELDLYDDQNRHCGLKDNGEIEENIPEVTCTTSGKTKHAFVKKKASKVKVKVTKKKPATTSKTTNLKKRTYKADKISKTVIFKDISISDKGKIEFNLNPKADTSPSLIFYPDETKTDNTIINPTAEATGSAALDQIAPKTSIKISGTKDLSGVYNGPATITLTGNDNSSGILKIEYSLDNGQTVQTYKGPFIISTPGKITIQFKAIDKLGNEEIPQTITIEIAVPPTPTPTPTSSNSTSGTTSSSSDNSSNTTSSLNVVARSEATRQSISSPPSVLGLEFTNPGYISDQINVERILDEQKNINPASITQLSSTQILGGLLLVSGGIVALASLGLIATFSPWNLFFRRHSSFVKPCPK